MHESLETGGVRRAQRFSAAIRLHRWCWSQAIRQQPGALCAAIIAIALGVALALGIDLVNRSALNEFSQAFARINGDAQLRVVPRSSQLPEQVLDLLETNPAVLAASPIIDISVPVWQADQADYSRLRIVGLDVFRAAKITPRLIPQTDGHSADPQSILSDDAIFLSQAARQQFNARLGDTLVLLINGQKTPLRIRGSLPGIANAQAIAVVDIAVAQSRLSWLGMLSRIDIQLHKNIGREQARHVLLPAGHKLGAVGLSWPDQNEQNVSNMSRAYRVNLNVLALVALLTGGFIVYAGMTLIVTHLTRLLGILTIIGAAPNTGGHIVLGLGLGLGLVGAAVGVLLGIGLAWALLLAIGGDLGGGYFSAAGLAQLHAPWLICLAFGGLGVFVSITGAIVPAWRLRGGQGAPLDDRADHRSNSRQLGVAAGLLVIGAGMLALPAIDGLPLPAYLAIACWILAGTTAVSPVMILMCSALAKRAEQMIDTPLIWLTWQRVSNPKSTGKAALTGVVASVALVSAMAIMVNSFRHSLDNWLSSILPAHLYVVLDQHSPGSTLSADTQRQLSSAPGVDKVRYSRRSSITLNQHAFTGGVDKLALIAHRIDRQSPAHQLPIVGAIFHPKSGEQPCLPVYPSEPAASRFDLALGQQLALPLARATNARATNHSEHCFYVAAFWRDYARQQGALAINLADYRQITGDLGVGSAALWLKDGADPLLTLTALRARLAHLPGIHLRSTGSIRQTSMTIFDRSFALTYALEAAALLVGLFGVATTYAGQALSRSAEFGVLRHLGLTRSDITRLFALEAGASVGFGVLWGGLLGMAISQILIHWVNPQSFHWRMQTYWPLATLTIASLSLLVLAIFSAVIAARQAGGKAPIIAVRVDST